MQIGIKRWLIASLELEDPCYMIDIAFEHSKYLKFHFDDKLYQFNVLPVCSASYVLTKTLTVISSLK